MALEVAEERHDCCPPKLELEPSECCVIDDVSIDARDGLLKLADDRGSDSLAAASYADMSRASPLQYHVVAHPPDPPPQSIALHKLICVFLN